MNRIFLMPLILAAMIPSLATAHDRDAPLPFGLGYIVAGQTARLAVVNVTRFIPGEPILPCRATLSFVNGSGQVATNTDGLPATERVTLAAGASTTFEFPAPADATGAANRVALRPVLQKDSERCALLASAEVFDGTTGATTVVQPSDPVLPQTFGVPLNLFGLHSIVSGQTARITATNLAPRGTPSDPYRLELGFVDAAGHTVINVLGQPLVRQVVLQAGASAFLDLPAPSGTLLMRPVVRSIAPLRPSAQQAPVVVGAEIFDSVSGVTKVAYPSDPVLPVGR
jgi:hypothetical protein